MRQRDAGAAIAAAISFCSLVTLHGELQPADVPFDLVEQPWSECYHAHPYAIRPCRTRSGLARAVTSNRHSTA